MNPQPKTHQKHSGKRPRRRMRPPDAPAYTRRPESKPRAGERPLSGSEKTLKLIPLGGNEEVGRNMMLVQYGQEILIIDLGLQFPEEDMPGVDYIIPDISYLKGKEKWIRGVVITHGHYDHIGAVPHLLGPLGNPPVYSTDLTCAMIQKKMEDVAPKTKARFHTVKTRDKVKLGIFTLEFFGVSHNIPASLGVVVTTPAGLAVHTGDFKIDENAQDNNKTDMEFIRALADRNVLVLMCDSTNASHEGHQLSESQIEINTEELFRQTKGRMIFATFASLLSRVQQILSLAEKYGRNVLIEGYSMRTNVEIGRELGYIKVKQGTVLAWEEARKLPNEKLLVMCTGAQGEDNAALMRIANREHKYLSIEPGDTVIFSSSVVPGNDRSVQRLKDGLFREGADVIDYKMLDIHAGGHAHAGDLIDFMKVVRPQYVMPVMGNYSFLIQNKKNAIKAGVPENRILVAENGQTVEFTNGEGYVTHQRIPINYVFVDGLGVGDVSHVVLRDRSQMAEDGMVVVIATIDRKTGRLINRPDIISRGFIYIKESGHLIRQSQQFVERILRDHEPRVSANDSYIRNKIRDELGIYLFQKTERRPMILPVIIEV